MLSLSFHAKKRLSDRYRLTVDQVNSVTYVELAGDHYWLVLNGSIDTIAVIRDNTVITFLRFDKNVTNKSFRFAA